MASWNVRKWIHRCTEGKIYSSYNFYIFFKLFSSNGSILIYYFLVDIKKCVTRLRLLRSIPVLSIPIAEDKTDFSSSEIFISTAVHSVALCTVNNSRETIPAQSMWTSIPCAAPAAMSCPCSLLTVLIILSHTLPQLLNTQREWNRSYTFSPLMPCLPGIPCSPGNP